MDKPVVVNVHAGQELIRLVQAGEKIAAIKHVRANFACGLKEAKEFVDSIEKGISTLRPPMPPNILQAIEMRKHLIKARNMGGDFFGVQKDLSDLIRKVEVYIIDQLSSL